MWLLLLLLLLPSTPPPPTFLVGVAPTAIGRPYIFGVCSVSVRWHGESTESLETRTLSSGATTEELVMLPHGERLLPRVAFTRAAKSSCVASNRTADGGWGDGDGAGSGLPGPKQQVSFL